MKLPKFKVPKKLESRKLWLSLAAAFVTFGNGYWGWGLEIEEVRMVVLALLAFVGFEGVADAVERVNGK